MAVPGQPLSCTVYVAVAVPIKLAAGSKSNVPAVALRLDTVPPVPEVKLVTVNVGVQPLIPVSGSVTLASRPLSPTIFMWVWALNAAGGVTTGASFSGLTVIVKVWVADVLVPPPLSWTLSVIVAVPFWLAAGV